MLSLSSWETDLMSCGQSSSLCSYPPKNAVGIASMVDGSANIISTLQTTYNAAASWITELPANTRIPKLLICANIPPLEIYLKYLSTRHAIRLLFLPMNHPPFNKPKEDKNAQHPPWLQRVMSFISGWTSIQNENRLPEGHYQINQLQPPIHMEKSKDVTRVHRQWISSLPGQSIVAYTDGSKLDNSKVGAGWAIYCIGSGIYLFIYSSLLPLCNLRL
jgi:hypothetical protein